MVGLNMKRDDLGHNCALKGIRGNSTRLQRGTHANYSNRGGFGFDFGEKEIYLAVLEIEGVNAIR
jgi:hypothetical protein